MGSNELTSWKKGLVSVDLNGNKATDEGESISYDRIGNPTTYLGATLTWFGRQLTSYTTADKTISYKYDSDGLRTEKIVDGVKHEYVYIGDQLHYEKRGSKNIFYFYDCNGYLTGLEYDGTTYYPATTLNGDVVAIYDHNGNCLVEYEYDAWGNVLAIKDANGNAITDENHIANINPIRYRGYYLDSETGLYYLQSRYYNPEVGRFLNSDSISDSGAGVLGYNTFIYCANNPVNALDPSGHWIIKNAIKWVAQKISSGVKKIREKTSAIDKTYSKGYNLSGSPSVTSFNAQIGVSLDTKGNVAIQSSFASGLTGGSPGVSFTIYESSTNAPNITKLEDTGYQIGGTIADCSIGAPVAVGGDILFIPDNELNTMYFGVSRNIGIGTPGKEFHVEIGNTQTINNTKFNVFDEIEGVCVKIMEW